MLKQPERRASRLILFRQGRGVWILALIAALILLLVFIGIGSPEGSKVSLQNLTSLTRVENGVSRSLSNSAPVETLPQPLQIRIEGLFSEIQAHPENKEALLRELRRVLQLGFRGQEDCWSCPGSEYFERFEKISGGADGRKPMGLQDWIALGDEAFEKQRLDEAREDYTEALQMIDERAFQPDEAVDTQALQRMNERCQQLNCR